MSSVFSCRFARRPAGKSISSTGAIAKYGVMVRRGQPDKASKACHGGCSWVKLPAFVEELRQLDEDDVVAGQYFSRLMIRATRGGIGPEDYRAPEGLSLRQVNKPWIAAFATDGPTMQHRLYWGEAPEDQPSLVACGVGSKPFGSRVPRHIWRSAQDSHINTAISRLRSWCRRNGYTYRKLRE
ncbi:hypothetical protein ACWDSJ_13960 [Nocardia sp. NPDC003482]